MLDAELPRVAVLSLGGTVAMTAASGTSGAIPTVTADELVAQVPGLRRRADVVTGALSSVPSASLRLVSLLEAIPQLENLCAQGADGIVLTTGTDTLEEVSYLIDLFWRRDEPVVITGAMRTADAASSDGPANLLAAVTVAASPTARGLGCLTVMNDGVHSGRFVRKTHTTRVDAFASVGPGPLGRVHEGRAELGGTAPRARTILPLHPGVDPVPTVALLRLALDLDVELLSYAAQTYDGIVVEAFGAGHVPEWWVDALHDAHQKVPVVVTSRTGSGAMLRRSYGFRGSEKDLLELGLHLFDDMDGVKARILLTAALLTSSDRSETDSILRSVSGASTDTPHPERLA